MTQEKKEESDECPYCKGTGRLPASPASRIKTLRESHGETQAQFAAKCGISRTQIANIETGFRGKPSVDLLLRIANAYYVSVDWLLGRK